MRKPNIRAILLRSGAVGAGLAAWFATQSLIARRPFPESGIGDRVFEVTSPVHHYLTTYPEVADSLLIVSSFVIDVLGIFLLASAIFGKTCRPFLGLLMVFALRQMCQGLCALPAPEGMIWRYPGFPSLLVTYGTSTDLFFSGHTSIAVFGSTELVRRGGKVWPAVGVLIAVFEMVTVLVLRAHYTMDVFTGAVTALWVSGVAAALAPRIDKLLEV